MEENNENLENNDEFKKRIQDFIKNFFGEEDGMLFDSSNMSISNSSILDDFFSKDDGLTYRTSSYSTPDGSKITISAGYGPYELTKPTNNMSIKEKIKKLQEDLDSLVENEEYEKAAETRDLINSLKKGEVVEETKTTDISKDDNWVL